MARTKKENDPELVKELNDLALRTRNWARHIRAYVDPETDVHGYFTVDDWVSEFEEKKSKWRLVKWRMVELGIPIAMDDFGGHYIGKDGDQAKTAASMVKRVITMLETVRIHLEAMQQSGKWEDCEPILTDGLSKSNFDISLMDVTKLLEGGGFKAPSQLSLPNIQN